jgi:hypothetical protein
MLLQVQEGKMMSLREGMRVMAAEGAAKLYEIMCSNMKNRSSSGVLAA